MRFQRFNSFRSTVRLGDYDTSKVEDCDYSDPEDPDCSEPVQDIRVKSYVAHPNFDKEKVLHDIGLIQLEVAANFQQRNIKPICLPFTSELQMLPKLFIVIGWGRTEKASRSAILQKATLPLYDQSQCYHTFSQLSRKQIVFSEGQFCAGGDGKYSWMTQSDADWNICLLTGKIDACRGDSGSSIQAVGIVNGRPKMVLHGVVSYGISLCGVKEGIPGVYTKVSKYLLWILTNMQWSIASATNLFEGIKTFLLSERCSTIEYTFESLTIHLQPENQTFVVNHLDRSSLEPIQS